MAFFRLISHPSRKKTQKKNLVKKHYNKILYKYNRTGACDSSAATAAVQRDQIIIRATQYGQYGFFFFFFIRLCSVILYWTRRQQRRLRYVALHCFSIRERKTVSRAPRCPRCCEFFFFFCAAIFFSPNYTTYIFILVY